MICSAVRTPVTKAKKGYLKDTAPELMLSFVLKAAAQRAMSDWVREDLLAKETLAHKQAMETIMSLGITS